MGVVLSQRDALVLLLGAAALAYVIHTEAPGRWRLAWSAVAAVALLGLYVVAWPHLAPQAGPMRLAGAAVWGFPLWAALLHDSTDDDDERGPWVLALLPLAIFGVLVAVGPPGPAGGSEWAGRTSVPRLVGWALAACAIAVAFVWTRRRTP